MENFKFDGSTRFKKSAFCLSCKKRIDFESSHINNLGLDMDCNSNDVSVSHVYFESMEPFYNIECKCGKDMIIVDRCVADLMEEYMNSDILKKHISGISIQCGHPVSKGITTTQEVSRESYEHSGTSITFSVKPLSVHLLINLLNKAISTIYEKYEDKFEACINDNFTSRDLKFVSNYALTVSFRSKENSNSDSINSTELLILFKNHLLDLFRSELK